MLNPRKIKPYIQETRATCGPAALRTFLFYFGIERSEKTLAKICATDSMGTRPRMIQKALEKFGFQTKSGSGENAKKSKEILDYWINKRNAPVIVDWFAPSENAGEGHYSVVVGLEKNFVFLADPAFERKKEKVRKIAWPDFARVWFDWNGDYITPQNLIVRSWLTGHKEE